MKSLIKPVVCLLALSIPAFASADVESEEVSVNAVKIKYTVAEAATDTGYSELEAQIKQAAEQACDMPSATGGRVSTPSERVEKRRCMNRAVAAAMGSVKETLASKKQAVAGL